MSLFLCPLCGKQCSIRFYDPTDFDADIYAIQKVGLGRGKGFKTTDKFSILNSGDPTVELLKDRILLLSKTLLDHKCLDSREVLSALNIQTVNPRILAEKDKIIEDLSEEVINLERRVNEGDGRLRKKDSIIEDLSEKNVELSRRAPSHAGELRKKDEIIEDLSEKNVELSRRASSLASKLKDKDKIIEDLSESNINLSDQVSSVEEDLEHRTDQAKKLRRIARRQKDKIASLEEQISDLSEELI